MVETVINFINEHDIRLIVYIFIIGWYFSRQIRAEIKEETNAIKEEGNRQERRIDRLYEMFIDLLKTKQ